MIPSIRSEFRKLLTVRSTYVILLICLAFTVLIAFWGIGFHMQQSEITKDTLARTPYAVVQLIGLLLGLVGMLMITHEYRYNSIMYTLTAARRRWHTLVGKLVVITVFTVVAGSIFAVIAPYLAKLGLQMHGLTLPVQDLPLKEIIVNCMFYCWGSAMFGAIIALLIRTQAGAIAIYLLVPLIIENLLTLLLKDDVKYLPFTALSRVVAPGNIPAGAETLTYTQNVLIVLAYVIGGWLAVTVLFSKRDAN